jgi:hypothetical protein
MKKTILSLSVLFFAATATFAQDASAGNQSAATTQNPEALQFVSDVHDFGNIPQNVPAEHEFTFTNTGKEPIILQRVQASCGCTTPSYSKDPVLPGQKGSVKAAYNAAAAGHFSKTITVFSNIGTKVLTIKGNVEKAPDSSVPENKSVIKK